MEYWGLGNKSFSEAHSAKKEEGFRLASISEISEIVGLRTFWNPEGLSNPYIASGTIAVYERAGIPVGKKVAFKDDYKNVKMQADVPKDLVGKCCGFLMPPGTYEFKMENGIWIFSPVKPAEISPVNTNDFAALGSIDDAFLRGINTDNFQLRKTSYIGPIFSGGLYDVGVFSTRPSPADRHNFFIVKPNSIDSVAEVTKPSASREIISEHAKAVINFKYDLRIILDRASAVSKMLIKGYNTRSKRMASELEIAAPAVDEFFKCLPKEVSESASTIQINGTFDEYQRLKMEAKKSALRILRNNSQKNFAEMFFDIWLKESSQPQQPSQG